MGKTAFYGKKNGEENGWAKVRHHLLAASSIT
jgi:hypothetical protein